MISDVLFPLLDERFPNRGLNYLIGKSTVAIFPAVHSEVGPIEIHDHGDEITLVAGKFSHGHFGNYDEHLSQCEKEVAISEDVISFLENVFSDRVIFWGAHHRVGGWNIIGDQPIPEKKGTFVWSGPTEGS